MKFHVLRNLTLAALLVILPRLRADPVLNEIMAANHTTLKDEDGAFSDWIELYNPDADTVNLSGWYLSNSPTNKTAWQFPNVLIPARAYLVVFASGKNRRDPSGRLHTNFRLNAAGEYLGLIKPDGIIVAAEFSPSYPALADDVAYGLVTGASGNLKTAAILSQPTPGAVNAAAAPVPITQKVIFSKAGGPFRSAFSLELTGAGTGQNIRYVLISATAGKPTSMPEATSSLYAGAIAVNASVTLRAAVFSADGKSHGTVTEACYSKISASLDSFSSQMPVLIIDSLNSGALVKDSLDHSAWLSTYAPATGNTPSFTATASAISPISITVRGASSAQFPKKGYNFKFTDDTGVDRAALLLDLPKYEKWALVAPWKYDQSYLNNSLIYDLSNAMGRWAPRTRLAEVFFNANGNDVDQQDYAGIYIVSDRVEVGEGRVDVAFLATDDVTGSKITGGYILKIDSAEPGEVSWRTTRQLPGGGESSIILVSPNETEVVAKQVDYIKGYVQRMEDALFSDRASGWARRTYLDYIDRGAWVDHHLLNTFSSNPDAFLRSAYFTKDKNGKMVAGPVWDFDRALGSANDTRSYLYDTWANVGVPDPWRIDWWGVIASDPEFMQDWIDRWQSLRRAELSYSGLLNLVEKLSARVGTAAAARDAGRWPENTSPYGSYSQQIDHLKGWLTLRAEWIDRQFLAAPNSATSGTSLVFTPPAGAQLAYTVDGSDPRALGGAIAPNALLSSSPVTLPATTNIHIRSYRADLKGVFPGSPWSSVLGSATSSPLTPPARLVNISARAIVGAGENALIVGVIVADTEGKPYLSRAAGPSLGALGVNGTVADPQLSIISEKGAELFRNNGWESGPDALLLPSYARSVGAFAFSSGSRDSALASTIPAGSYSVFISTPTNKPGVGLAELYELDDSGRTVNLSTRAQVRLGEGGLFGGFVVKGPAFKRMLIRAVGPTLSLFGVGNALADPILTIFSGQKIVATNDRWQSDQAAAIAAAAASVGAFNLTANSQDAALLITVAPGAYTVEVKGKGETEGIALLEIYEIP